MSIHFQTAKITASNCILLMCDLQKGAFEVLPGFEKMINNTISLIKILKLMDVPMIIAAYEPNSYRFRKLNICGTKVNHYTIDQYNMCIPKILDEIDKYAKKRTHPLHVILTGLETHIFVENTAIKLRNLGYEVHIVVDCCISRLPDDRVLALVRMRDIGCQITTTENIVGKMINELESREKYKNIRDKLVGITPSECLNIFAYI